MRSFLITVLLSVLPLSSALAWRDTGIVCSDSLRTVKFSMSMKLAMQGFEAVGVSSNTVYDCRTTGQNSMGLTVVQGYQCVGGSSALNVTVTLMMGVQSLQFYNAAGAPVFSGVCANYKE